jgi:type II secretory pathway pseudopilin PulG
MRVERSGCVVVARSREVRAAAGLTLVELLITITVLAISVALVIPQMSQTGVLRVQSAVRTITSDIALAQTEAMAYQTRRAVYFGVVVAPGGDLAFEEGNGYAVFEPTTEDLTLANMASYALFLPEKRGEAYARGFDNSSAYGGAMIEEASFDGQPVLLFDELGGPISSVETGATGNGGQVIVRSDAYGVGYSITVEAMTGRVTVDLIEEEVEADPVVVEAEDENGG